MYKYKKAVLGITILLILFSLGFLTYLHKTAFIRLNPVSAELSDEVWNGRTRVERFESAYLMCNGYQVPQDYIEKTFYVPLDMEDKYWETLEFTSAGSEYQLVFSEDFTRYDKQQLIAEGKSVEFLMYNDTEFSTYHIIFTGLPVMDISTVEGIEHQKEISGWSVYYDTNFSTYGYVASMYEGHVRGNTSTLYPKKGYKINLKKQENDGTIVNNKLSLFGMREDDDWILYALYSDESKIRAKLSIDLWEEMGAYEVESNATYNSRLTYIELIVDEAYHGMYALMEPIDAKQLNMQEEDYLYKREEPAELDEAIFAAATDPLAHVQGFEIKEGVPSEEAWLPMAEFAGVLNASDKEFTENIGQMIDADNAIRLWLYIQMIAGLDQQTKNVFYVAKKEGDGYHFTFAPWDMDLTWGNTSDSEVEEWYTRFDPALAEKDFTWETGDRLIELNVNGTADKMLELYEQLRAGIFSEKQLEWRIAELDHLVRDSGAFARDQVRWPEGAYAEDYSRILTFAKERLAYLDKKLYEFE